MHRDFVLTSGNRPFSFSDLDSNVYDIDDIAHALSLICRYGGSTPFLYSVAQHSCLMAVAVFRDTQNPVLALDALMHDAEEAYTGDMKAPLKNMFPDFRRLSANINFKIREAFHKHGVPLSEHRITKIYDTRILIDEKRALFPGCMERWPVEREYQPLGVQIVQMPPRDAAAWFRKLFWKYATSVACESNRDYERAAKVFEPEPPEETAASQSEAATDCVLPEDSAERKAMPIATGLLDYFPLAVAEIARVSKIGSEKHNPGEPVHWSRGKSTDHADCIARHLIDRGRFSEDGVRHTAALAWRALALLQEELEAELGRGPVSR